MKSIEEIYNYFLENGIAFTDSRQSPEGGIFFALKGENFDGNDFAEKAISEGANYAVVDKQSLGGNNKIIVVNDVLSTMQKLATHHRRKLKTPLLAITGTNGKTTTKELVACVLSHKFNILATQSNLNNHIGVPLTLLSLTEKHEIGIIEMGANHPGEIELLCSIAEPDWGIITNVGKAHLEGFGSFEGVKEAKGELYDYISKSGRGIFINSNNEHLVGMAPEDIEKYSYGVTPSSAQLTGEVTNADLSLVCKVLFPKGWLYIKTKLTGAYNLENILAASRIGVFFGIDPLLIQRGIEEYQPSNIRSQVINKGSLTIIADCYNANPSSMEVSLKNFFQINKPDKTLILGDMLELGNASYEEHQKIVDLVIQSGINNVFLVGECFIKTSCPDNFQKFNNIEEMIIVASTINWENRIILIKGSRGNKLENILEML